jgi:hypothetical protein
VRQHLSLAPVKFSPALPMISSLATARVSGRMHPAQPGSFSGKVFSMSVARNLPIARKFTVAFGTICLLCTGLAVYSFITMRSITAMASRVRTVNVPSLIDLATMRFNANSARRAELALLACSAPSCT